MTYNCVQLFVPTYTLCYSYCSIVTNPDMMLVIFITDSSFK